MEDRWLSVDEIGEYLGIKRDTVYAWISKKGLSAHRMGRLWKLKKDEVDAWVKAGGAASEHKAQLLNYLKAAGLELGLLINFGSYPKTKIIRIANTNFRDFRAFRG